MSPLVRRAVWIACALAFFAGASSARADGDPASDILVTEDVYYGYGIDLRSKEAAQLPALLQASREAGYELKVALISGFQDLGIATWMWLDPREYARYLGTELSLVYKGNLLVLMRNGYGVFRDGEVPGVERRTISRLDRPRRAANFLDAAIDASVALAKANDIELTVPDVPANPEGVATPTAVHDGTLAGQAPVGSVTATATASAAAPADAGGSGATWLFLVPVGVFILAAGIAARRSRKRAA